MRHRYEILGPRRIVRQPRSGGRRIEWHVSARTRSRFDDMLEELLELEGIDDPIVNEHRFALMEDIRGLPGYPTSYDPDRDVIVPVTTSETR